MRADGRRVDTLRVADGTNEPFTARRVAKISAGHHVRRSGAVDFHAYCRERVRRRAILHIDLHLKREILHSRWACCQVATEAVDVGREAVLARDDVKKVLHVHKLELAVEREVKLLLPPVAKEGVVTKRRRVVVALQIVLRRLKHIKRREAAIARDVAPNARRLVARVARLRAAALRVLAGCDVPRSIGRWDDWIAHRVNEAALPAGRRHRRVAGPDVNRERLQADLRAAIHRDELDDVARD